MNSTQGVAGFVLDGEPRLHRLAYDAYPLREGVDLLEWARGVAAITDGWPLVESYVRNIEVGSYSEGPVTFKAAYMAMEFWDGREFLQDSYFCEWGYVLDLDKERLDVYRGNQTEEHGEAFEKSDGTYVDGVLWHPCKRVASWYFEALPTKERFEKTMAALAYRK